jgi:thiamine-phosphate pyrophosphorylase
VLVPLVQSRDVAFLLRDHAHLVARTGADGIHTEDRVSGLRQALPDDAILGAGCSGLRHEAMVAGEDGADYVAFGPWSAHVGETLAWWQETMELPCVAYGNIDSAAIPLAAAAGADFVMVDDAIWHHPDSPAAGVTSAIAAIANAPRR